jgi:proteic killer suppression protein
MIKGFADEGTEDIWNGDGTKAARKTCPKALWPVAARKLDIVNAAHAEKDLRVPPGNRFERLKGKLTGKCSIRINDQYRVVFRWKAGDATEVQITDYH